MVTDEHVRDVRQRQSVSAETVDQYDLRLHNARVGNHDQVGRADKRYRATDVLGTVRVFADVARYQDIKCCRHVAPAVLYNNASFRIVPPLRTARLASTATPVCTRRRSPRTRHLYP